MVRFGLAILPERSWSEAERQWRTAEDLGFDHAWTYDHLVWAGLPESPWYGTTPTITAAALVASGEQRAGPHRGERPTLSALRGAPRRRLDHDRTADVAQPRRLDRRPRHLSGHARQGARGCRSGRRRVPEVRQPRLLTGLLAV